MLLRIRLIRMPTFSAKTLAVPQRVCEDKDSIRSGESPASCLPYIVNLSLVVTVQLSEPHALRTLIIAFLDRKHRDDY